MKGNVWRIVAALVLTAALVIATVASTSAVGEGVTQVSVTGNATEILPGQTINLTVTVLANSTDIWGGGELGNITVRLPNGSDTDTRKTLGGTGTATDSEAYPGSFSGTASTATTGTYNVEASVQTAGGVVVTGNTTFVVKDFIVSADPTRITPNSSTTITVSYGSAPSSTLVVWVEHPLGGNTSTSVFNDYTAVYPDDFGGSANSTEVGVYTMGVIADSVQEDTGTFDVQNASPHLGSFAISTSDACAACHRAHTAEGPKLLTAGSQYDLCLTCHNGDGANTKVTDGMFLGSTEGTQNGGLRGGGFEQAKMDTNANGTTLQENITSTHTIGATSPTVWGSGALGSNDVGETITTLECGSCHNPHGNDNYRILRPIPQGLVTDLPSSGITIVDDLALNTYTISYDLNSYRDLGKYDVDVLTNVTDWCSQCHTRYKANAGDGSNLRGDTVFKYSHMTDGLGGECFKCHVAHGTTADMGSGYSAGPDWPGNTSTVSWQTSNSESQYSRLLHLDNRGVCLQCHTDAELTAN